MYAAILGGKDFEVPQLPDGFPTIDLFQGDDESQRRIGLRLREEGLKPKHPVIIVPGFVTSGLELWHGEECAKKFFRYKRHLTSTLPTPFKCTLACSSVAQGRARAFCALVHVHISLKACKLQL